MSYLVGLVASYLLGSVPFGFLIAKAKGVDIRTVGSGNIGATNVFRTLGKGPGVLTFALDFCKGLVPVLLLSRWAAAAGGGVGEGNMPYLQLLCGAGAMLGHSFPVFLGFRGGKGVATGVGLAMGMAPVVAGIALGIWIVVFLAGRYVSLASIIAALAVAGMVWCPRLLEPDRLHVVPTILTVLCLLIVARHRGNIARLFAGTENRFSFRRKHPEDGSAAS